jgi:uncharacterized ubiquitin-like protein YukD
VFGAFISRLKLFYTLLILALFSSTPVAPNATMAASGQSPTESEASCPSKEDTSKGTVENTESFQPPAETAAAGVSIAQALANPKTQKAANKEKVVRGNLEKTESALRNQLVDARVRRDAIKKAAKVETVAVKRATKKIERIKAKAKLLSNNDLLEVFAMRNAESKQKEINKKK